MITYLEVNIDLLPYTFELQLTHYTLPKTYQITLKYNDDKGFFVLDIGDVDGIIVEGIKLLYGNYVFERIRNTRLPDEWILPLDPKGLESTITLENINDIVKIFIIEPGVFLDE